MESAPPNFNRPPPPFPAPPRTVDFSALEFILGLIAVITIPALIYAFFFTINCPPNPFSRSRRSSTDSLPSFSSDNVSAAAAAEDANKEKEAVMNVKFLKEKHAKDIVGGDCPVCLSVFADGDEVKLLSACKHSFHATCIDTWFKTQPNCPVCRNPVAVKHRPENGSGNGGGGGGGGGEADRQQGLPDAANLV